jgi:purine-binding chemotaxis protein CheW
MQIDQDRFEPPPETLQQAQREFILGALKLDDGLLLLLDIDRVLDTETN